jgi:hypothetical protein
VPGQFFPEAIGLSASLARSITGGGQDKKRGHRVGILACLERGEDYGPIAETIEKPQGELKDSPAPASKYSSFRLRAAIPAEAETATPENVPARE